MSLSRPEHQRGLNQGFQRAFELAKAAAPRGRGPGAPAVGPAGRRPGRQSPQGLRGEAGRPPARPGVRPGNAVRAGARGRGVSAPQHPGLRAGGGAGPGPRLQRRAEGGPRRRAAAGLPGGGGQPRPAPAGEARREAAGPAQGAEPWSRGGEGQEPPRRSRSRRNEEEGTVAENPLEAYATDLVARAAAGRLDPLVGRDAEITRMAQVLCRRRKNNPLLVGEPGVGKTAIVEGLARRIHEGKVPEPLKARADLRPGSGGPARRQPLPGRFRGTPQGRAQGPG